jgi:hypothetical protein
LPKACLTSSWPTKPVAPAMISFILLGSHAVREVSRKSEEDGANKHGKNVPSSPVAPRSISTALGPHNEATRAPVGDRSECLERIVILANKQRNREQSLVQTRHAAGKCHLQCDQGPMAERHRLRCDIQHQSLENWMSERIQNAHCQHELNAIQCRCSPAAAAVGLSQSRPV